MQEFKDRLKELREESGLSMKELGLKIGVSDAAVCKWENGISEPKITYILRLSKYFECSTDFLLGVTDDYASAKFQGGKTSGKDGKPFGTDTFYEQVKRFEEPNADTEIRRETKFNRLK